MPRPSFGPPRHALGAFGWAVLQLPRALVWTLRERTLRSLLLQPALITFAVTCALCIVAVAAAGPLEAALLDRQPGLGGAVVWLGVRAALTLSLLIAAVFSAWQLSGAITAASLERMAFSFSGKCSAPPQRPRSPRRRWRRSPPHPNVPNAAEEAPSKMRPLAEKRR
jgi:hypothetical protein